jgi:hypothetical protein
MHSTLSNDRICKSLYMVIDWEEIFLSSEGTSEVIIEPLEKLPISSGSIEFGVLKISLLDYFKSIDYIQIPLENYLTSDLAGNIILQNPIFSSSINNTISYSITIVDDLLKYYENNFQKDDEVVIYLCLTLIQENRRDDLNKFLLKYNSQSKLPLSLEIFLILGGVLRKELPNIILHGDEDNLLNILYKYKFFSLSKSEQILLYDSVITNEKSNLLGIVFYIYKDVLGEIRNIKPIQEIISKKFTQYDDINQKIFLDSYLKTGNYLKSYFCLKKVYSKRDLKNWTVLQKNINGKIKLIKSNKEDSIISLINHFLEKKDITIFSPFELYQALNDNNHKNNIISIINTLYKKNPGSYILNQARAIENFINKDYINFFKFTDKSGSFQNKSEIIYLKAICLMEIGLIIESGNLIKILLEKFPDSVEVKELYSKLKNHNIH